MLTKFLFFALVAYAAGAAIENCHSERLVACGNPLQEFRTKMGQSFPITEEQVQDLCGRMDEAKKCAEEYQNKCMTPLQLQTMGFLTEGSLLAYNEFCTSGSKIRTDYLKHASCLDDQSKTDEAKGYYKYVEAALENLAEIAPDLRLRTACCGYQWLQDKSTTMGKAKCGQEAVDAFQRVVDMAVSALPSVFCSGFEPDSKLCQEVLPPAGSQPKGTIRNSPIAQSFANIYFKDLM